MTRISLPVALLTAPIRIPGALFLLACLMAVAGPGGLEAQEETRAELLETARGEFNDAVAVRLLLAAADPGTAPLDSIWAVSVHELAFALVRMGNPEAAGLWLRWVARHGSDWPLDRSWFPPVMSEVWERAGAGVEGWPSLPLEVVARWDWTEAVGSGADGGLDLDPGAGSGTVVTLAGAEGTEVMSVPDLSERPLEPGSYRVSVSAGELQSPEVEVEVLPGVVTRLRLDAIPGHSAETLAEGRARLARIEWGEGPAICTNGALVGGGTAVVTPLSGLGTRSRIRVVLPSGEVLEELSVGAVDHLRGLAFIGLGGAGSSPVGTVGVASEPYVWAPYHSGCGDPRWAWSGVSLRDAGRGVLDLSPLLPAEAVGAPLVTEAGSMVGLVLGGGAGLSLQDDDPLIASALSQVMAGAPRLQGAPRSAPSWRWIGAGVALAGLGVFLATSGGQDDVGGGELPTPRPTTGTIVITFPGGGP